MHNIAVIILAAGKGTRMKSDRAKVLHEIAGVPMIRYVVEAALAVVDQVVVVIGHQADAVREALASYPMLRFSVQQNQLGTGHAVMTALPDLPATTRDVVILCGDTPLIKAETLRTLIDEHTRRRGPLTLLAATLDDPLGYGRIVSDARGNVIRIVEESDATDAEKRITTVNTGTYCINVDFLKNSLPDLDSDNAQGEFYLTDVVEKGYRMGDNPSVLAVGDALEVLGINTKEELAKAERFL